MAEKPAAKGAAKPKGGKTITGNIKLQVGAGNANPAPPRRAIAVSAPVGEVIKSKKPPPLCWRSTGFVVSALVCGLIWYSYALVIGT